VLKVATDYGLEIVFVLNEVDTVTQRLIACILIKPFLISERYDAIRYYYLLTAKYLPGNYYSLK